MINHDNLTNSEVSDPICSIMIGLLSCTPGGLYEVVACSSVFYLIARL
jgi:hypothetical protein